MPVKSLDFRKESGIREITVDDSDVVVRVAGRDQLIPGFLDGFHVPGRNESGCTDECKVGHGKTFD
jgi:hypothetical protein